jgi:23S rRNA (adenine2503-C2)-methyltransferase
LLDHSLPSLTEALAARGHSKFRAAQVWRWALAQRAKSFADMNNVSLKLRAELHEQYSLSRPHIDQVDASRDGTRKYRFVGDDNTAFEAVFIPEVARGRGTNTLCISSQTGCSVGCKFCFTASLRRNRNLRPSEIVGQVLAVQDDLEAAGVPERVTNIVYMGMGEPLLNYDNVVQSVRMLIDPAGCDFSSRRVTISTSGIVKNLERLGHDVPTQLAISLNATTDEVRTRIMPINKTWPLDKLLAAMRSYPLRGRRRITVEYVLLGGVNDTDADAQRLTKLLRGIPVKLNLLPLNAHERTELVPPTAERVLRFQKILLDGGYVAFVRTPRGQDIAAACGQLGESAKA